MNHNPRVIRPAFLALLALLALLLTSCRGCQDRYPVPPQTGADGVALAGR